MAHSLGGRLRVLVPQRHQVPAKFWYDWLRGHHEAEMAFLGSIVKSEDRAIDIGGNRGVYAYRLWRLGARVEVFEPNPACSNVLEAWAIGKPRVKVHTVALSSRPGSATLHIPVDESGVEHDASASIEHRGSTPVRDQLVALRTLDSYGFNGVTLIKIDVEGHENSVLEGAARTLWSSRPALLIEIEQRHHSKPLDEVFGKVLAFGYQGFFLAAKELRPLDQFDADRHQSMKHFVTRREAYINNFLFLHRSKLAGGDYRMLVEEASETK